MKWFEFLISFTNFHKMSFTATTSNRKMQVELKGVSSEQCNKMYRRFNISINMGQMCAGGEEGFDSCRGTEFLLSN